MDTLRQDIGYTLRLFRKHMAFTLAIIAILALGIGGSTAIFSVVNNTLLREMMLPDIDRMVRIDDQTVGPTGRGDETNISPLNTAALAEQQTTFEALAVQDARTFVLTGDGDPARLRGAGVSEGWNTALGVQPVIGRPFTPEENAEGNEAEAVLIGYNLWQQRYAGSPSVLGRTITLNGRPRTVIGVMPAGFQFPYEGEIWTPIEYDRQDGQMHYLLTFGRLRDGVTVEQAEAELQAISARLAQTYPATNANYVMHATPLRENLVRGYDRTALALLAVVGFLLVLACVNVSGLLLVRMAVRRQEMIIRASLGASRARQIAQLMTESTVLSLIGGAAGLAVALLLWPYLGMLVPPIMSIELAQDASPIDIRVFGFTIGLALLAGIGVGVIPALRSAPANLGTALREGGRMGGTRSRGHTLRWLVVTEVTLAMALLIAAGGVVRGFWQSFGGDEGYEAESVLALRVSLPGPRYPGVAEREQATRAMLDNIAGVPGVQAVAITTTNPRLPSWTAEVFPDGVPEAGATATPIQFVTASPRSFEVLGTPILAGRDLSSADRAGSPPVAVISRSLAERLWPGQDAVGKNVQLTVAPFPFQVVGVAGDVRYQEDPYTDAVYIPYAQQAMPEFHLLVKTAVDPASLARPVQEAIWRADKDVPVFNVTALSDLSSREFMLERTGASIGAAFGGFSLLLAAFGIFGILSFTVAQRLRDGAIRVALGASPRSVGLRVLLEGVALVAIGCILGAAAGYGLTRVLRARLTSVAPLESPEYLGLFVLLTVIGTAACTLPARRASRVNPMAVLRED